MRKLIILTPLAISIFALAFSVTPQIDTVVEAGGSDCEVAGQVCRQMSQGIYNLCIELGGAHDTCAWQEAQNTISCMSGAGCPLHD